MTGPMTKKELDRLLGPMDYNLPELGEPTPLNIGKFRKGANVGVNIGLSPEVDLQAYINMRQAIRQGLNGRLAKPGYKLLYTPDEENQFGIGLMPNGNVNMQYRRKF